MPSRRVAPPIDLVDAATIDVPAWAGSSFRVTIAGDRTLATPTGATDGQRILIAVTQGAGGSHTLTLSGDYTLGSDVTDATLSTAEGAVDYLGVIYRAAADSFDVVAVARGY